MDRRVFLAGAAAAGAIAAAPRIAVADELPLGPLPGTRYPDPRVEAVDRRFKYKIGNAYIERIATGMRWAEGPVYVRDGGYLLWSDIPNNRMMRWSEDDGHVSVFRSPSNFANGNTRDREGRLVTCEHDSRRITRTEHDGTITVLMDKFEGKPLNAPNDIVVASDGAIWFTDPGFGIFGNYEGHKAEPELPPNVYRLDPRTGRATVVYVPNPGRPNGIAFSPDEKKLYIIVMAFPDNRPSEIRAFDVNGERLSNEKTFRPDHGRKHRRDAPGCGRQYLVRHGQRRSDAGWRALLCAHWRSDRQDPSAGDLRQSVFRRKKEQPAVYGRKHVDLFGVCGHRRRADAVSQKACHPRRPRERRARSGRSTTLLILDSPAECLFRRFAAITSGGVA